MEKGMQVEELPTKTIKVGERARKDLGDLDELVASIKDKGIIQPIVVDSKYNLLAGGRRLEAAKIIGLKVIPAVVRKTTGSIDPLEIELIENLHRLDFSWSERAALEKRIYDLKKEKDPNWSIRKQSDTLEQSVGKTSQHIKLAEAIEEFPELANAKTFDEAWKTLKKMEEAVVRESIVEDAKSRALKGVKIADKNYKVGDVIGGLKGLRSSEYHFAEVDPPYGVDINKRKERYSGNKGRTSEYQEIEANMAEDFWLELAQETYRVLADNTFCVWWYGWTWHDKTLVILRKAGFQVSDIPCIWTKGAQGQTASPDTMLGSSHEPFFVCRKGQAKLAKPGRHNTFEFSPVSPTKKIHPTEKPVELLIEMLETFTFPGTRIVIPLLGSGATLRACYRSGRIGFGWDLSQEFKKAFLSKVAEDEDAGLYGKDE